MIIVSGSLHLRPGAREAFVRASVAVVAQARASAGCRDFSISPDPIDPDRVNVYEEWESEEDLLAFRGDGPDAGMASSIVRAEVRRHVVSGSGPA